MTQDANPSTAETIDPNRPFVLPPELGISEDLTERVRRLTEAPAREVSFPYDDDPQFQDLFDSLARALHRRQTRHVLLVGERGVGLSTVVAELARRAANGSIPFLRPKRFLWVDARYVPPVESAPRLAGILQYVARHPALVVCIDNVAGLLRGRGGEDLRLLLLSVLARTKFQLVGLVTPREYEALTADQPDMQEFFNRVDVDEPDVETACKLLNHFAKGLEQRFELRIEPEAVRQAVQLGANYIFNEQLPGKALKILHRCCETADYEREVSGTPPRVTVDNVLSEVSQLSGVPQQTLRGIAERQDYQKSLGQHVVGQDEAVAAVARELGLIKAGMTDPDKPASVMLFVGQTGTGKTELAKALARFYSTSKRLQTYTMGNFVEAHSVAGIIGVPPGYVGHDRGGRLVNDLIADPYCVFLLDEADKAHPDALQPFLNLFDEGWVRDQRGVKAYADKAIFILTSNAAQKMIGDLHRQGKSMDEIREKVQASLSQIRHSKANRPVFSPEFLARLKRVVVFQPLDQNAMHGICCRLVEKLHRTWRKKREKEIDVPESLIDYIALVAHEKNQRSGGKEGGRIVRRLLSDYVEAPIQQAATERPQEYLQCQRVEIVCVGEPPEPAPPEEVKNPKVRREIPPPPEIEVRFSRVEPVGSFLTR